MTPVDVAIVGGGLVGASLATALGGSGRSVVLIETAAPAVAAPAWDERCIAINHASKLIFARLGVWAELAAEAEPILSTHISERGRFGVARFTAREARLPALGYNVPMRALGQRLWAAARAAGAVVHCPARLVSLTPGAACVSLQLATDSGPLELEARLVVAADGAGSPVRAQLGIAARTDDYGQSAIVSAMHTSRPHAGCAYERFTPDGPIALLPKPEPGHAGAAEAGRKLSSLVWTVPTAQVETMLAWSDEEFVVRAQEPFGGRLGRFSTPGRRVAHALTRVMSERLSAPRVLFAGNAAQALHPVAAQGFNLGLRDAAAIAQLLAEHPGDPGLPAVLDEYARRRTRDRALTAGFTDHLVRLFSNRLPGLAGLRHLGLLALDLTPPLKDAVMWQNLGFSGDGGRAGPG